LHSESACSAISLFIEYRSKVKKKKGYSEITELVCCFLS